MYLNLSKFIDLKSTASTCILINASEELDPLVMNIKEVFLKTLDVEYARHAFQVDRFFDFQLVNDIWNSPSLFSDKNLIELNFKTKPVDGHQKQIVELLKTFDSNNILILACDKLDKKDLNADWVQEINSSGIVLTCTGDDSEIRLWSGFLFNERGFTIEPSALDLLISLNQNNFSQLAQEINKLSLLFNAPYQITVDDAKKNLVDNAQFNVFALSNAYLKGEIPRANKIFQNICISTEDAILILWNLSEDIRKLIRIKGALKINPNFSQAINGLRIWGDAVSGFSLANQRLSYSRLLEMLNELAVIDSMLKGIKAGNPLSKLEQLVADFCK